MIPNLSSSPSLHTKASFLSPAYPAPVSWSTVTEDAHTEYRMRDPTVLLWGNYQLNANSGRSTSLPISSCRPWDTVDGHITIQVQAYPIGYKGSALSWAQKSSPGFPPFMGNSTDKLLGFWRPLEILLVVILPPNLLPHIVFVPPINSCPPNQIKTKSAFFFSPLVWIVKSNVEPKQLVTENWFLFPRCSNWSQKCLPFSYCSKQ